MTETGGSKYFWFLLVGLPMIWGVMDFVNAYDLSDDGKYTYSGRTHVEDVKSDWLYNPGDNIPTVDEAIRQKIVMGTAKMEVALLLWWLFFGGKKRA